MTNIIVVFPKPEEARGIKGLLVKNGFSVTAVCTTGAQAMSQVDCDMWIPTGGYDLFGFTILSAGRV